MRFPILRIKDYNNFFFTLRQIQEEGSIKTDKLKRYEAKEQVKTSAIFLTWHFSNKVG